MTTSYQARQRIFSKLHNNRCDKIQKIADCICDNKRVPYDYEEIRSLFKTDADILLYRACVITNRIHDDFFDY